MLEPPFLGLRVLDLTQGIAGPYCTMQMAALGAAVLKVEPHEGDYSRDWVFDEDEPSAVFETLNRNKDTIRLSPYTDRDHQIVRTLALHADVVITDAGASVQSSLGLEYEEVAEENPEVIYIELRPFPEGASGMFSLMNAGSELILQASCGSWDYVGTPGEAPVRIGADMISTWAGMHAFQACMAALYDRSLTGSGQKLSIDMLRSLMSMYTVRHYTESPDVEPIHWLSRCELPESFQRIYPLWKTATVPVLLEFFASGFVYDEEKWRAFLDEVGLGAITSDARFRSVVSRRQNWEAVKPLYEAAFSRYTAAELQEIVIKHGGVCMPANSIDLVIEDPQVRAMGIVREMQMPHGPKRYIEIPWEFSEAAPIEPQPVQEISAARLHQCLERLRVDTEDGGWSCLRRDN